MSVACNCNVAMHPSTGQPCNPSTSEIAPAMHPKLLMAARLGDTPRLKDLLSEGRVAAHPDFIVPVEGVTPAPMPSAAAELLLQGVTVEGDSALHIVAACGDCEEFLDSAKVIHDRAGHLLGMPNRNGVTPLHRAARAGNARMVSHLIDLAKIHGEARSVKELLRAENKLRETALHEAVRVGNEDIVARLMAEDSELATFPRDGESPLYLAAMLEEVSIARLLHDMSHGNLSYAGPNGQNALHAAVLRSKVMTMMLLGWNKGLTEQGDHDGCTPLHFAISQVDGQSSSRISICSKFPWIRFTTWITKGIPLLLLQTDPSSAYQPDHNGSFPIHVAAAVGANKAVSTFLRMFPDSAGLCDGNGRTFLHVAVERKRCSVVKHASGTPSLGWILNMQDSKGNTALHLAVMSGDTETFFPLFRNRQNPKQMIHRALARAGESHGVRRWDQFEEQYVLQPRREDEDKESEKLNNSTQTLGISSVLITTVTFGAAFALPGGYVADDHANGGTPTLAGRYSFEAFVMANALAFICSSLGTVGLMYSGITTVDLPIRQRHFLRSLFFVSSSLTSLVAAFALATYTVLAPVAHKTAVAFCVIIPVVVIYRSFGRFQKMYDLAGPLYVRAGIRPLLKLMKDVLTRMLRLYWPFIVIFGWAACAGHT